MREITGKRGPVDMPKRPGADAFKGVYFPSGVRSPIQLSRTW